MLDMDVGTGAEDLSFRKHDSGTVNPTGRLLGTTTGFTQLSPTGPDGAYSFAPNTTYVGSFEIMRISATEVRLTGTLGTATHSATDTFDSTDIGLLGFWANSNLFGSSSVPNEPNNGIDFTNVTIELIAVPEPTSLTLLAVGSLLLVRRTGRRAA
jgi:hypothetical protein